MDRIKNLGMRVELMPVDKTCNDISIGLYMRDGDNGPEYTVHSYAPYDGTSERIAHISGELERLAGMERVGNGDYLRFSCGSAHVNAMKRIFTRICRVASDEPGKNYSLSIWDKKGECNIAAESQGDGVYRFYPEEFTPMAERRTKAVMNGICKLTRTEADEGGEPIARFGCKTAHDAMVGMLLPDAVNVRAAAREQEELSGGGVLAAPSNAN